MFVFKGYLKFFDWDISIGGVIRYVKLIHVRNINLKQYFWNFEWRKIWDWSERFMKIMKIENFKPDFCQNSHLAEHPKIFFMRFLFNIRLVSSVKILRHTLSQKTGQERELRPPYFFFERTRRQNDWFVTFSKRFRLWNVIKNWISKQKT